MWAGSGVAAEFLAGSAVAPTGDGGWGATTTGVTI
jgi:hypothetical protein